MRRLRTASTRRLLPIVAVRRRRGRRRRASPRPRSTARPKPAPKPLDRAVYDAARTPPRSTGVTARIEFTNNLLPSGSLPDGTASPVLTGADRPPVADQRRPPAARAAVRQRRRPDRRPTAERFSSTTRPPRPPTPARSRRTTQAAREHRRSRHARRASSDGLAKLGQVWTLSGAEPTTTAGQPSYTVRIAPKDDGGLLGAAELAWDAVRGVPLRAAVYAQGQRDPVLELKATDISYGTIAAADVDADAARGREGDRDRPAAGVDAQGKPTHVAGRRRRSRSRLDFHARRARTTLAGLPRRERPAGPLRRRERRARAPTARASARSSSSSARPSRAQSRRRATGCTLPQVNIDGATGTELATALGTLADVRVATASATSVAGSVPPVAAENAARGLQVTRGDRGARPGQALRPRHGGRPRRPDRAGRRRLRLPRARTAPARRRRCGCCSA